ncbi:uncharacterized protein LOC111071553 [Drosophila obscura]|uniref:uncharacterized protein LOC111071553 n=1 Tax=Drosophila obscura TaxID=7282 RepID=UPI000BA1549B|nr:uncharacterized protein LOC111071553 [Drosophila obscura]
MLAFDFKIVAVPLLLLLLLNLAMSREVYMYVDMSGKPWEFEFRGIYNNTLRRRVTQVVYNGLWTDPMLRGRDLDAASCSSPLNQLISLAAATAAASFVIV